MCAQWQQNSKGVPAYGAREGAGAALDGAYRRLADHARMVSVCLADDVYPVARSHQFYVTLLY